MSVETRPRSTSDGGYEEPGRTGRREPGRGERPYRRYGAYTAGANALRLDRAIDFDDDEDDEIGDPASVTGGGRRVATQPSTTRRGTGGVAAPAGVPRPRRRTPWISDVTPAPAPDEAALPVSLPKAPFVLLMVGLVVVGVVGVLVLHTKINEGSFRLSDLRSTQAALDQQEQQLEQQLDELSSPGNLEAAAIRLGLVDAGEPAYINLPDGSIVGVPQPAGR